MCSCMCYLGNEVDVEEVVYEIMLWVFYGLVKFKGEFSFKIWLFCIVYNEFMLMLCKCKYYDDFDSIEEFVEEDYDKIEVE